MRYKTFLSTLTFLFLCGTVALAQINVPHGEGPKKRFLGTKVRVPQQYQTIGEAIDSVPGNLKIIVGPGEYAESLLIARGRRIVIQSTRGAEQTLLSGNGVETPVFLEPESSLTLRGLTIQAAIRTSNDQGAIYADGARLLELEGCRVTNSGSTLGFMYGGGLRTYDCERVVIKRCLFAQNSALGGGAIYISGCLDLEIRETHLLDNYAEKEVSNIYLIDSRGKIENCIIARGRTGEDRDVGAIDVYRGNMLIKNCTFWDNDTDAIAISGMSWDGSGGTTYGITIRNCIFAFSNGYAVDYHGGEISHPIEYSAFQGNALGEIGGSEPGRGCLVDRAHETLDDFDLLIDCEDPIRFDPACFVLSPTSPAVDAGDPSDDYRRESGDGGGRINMGAFGNTTAATLAD